LKKLAIIPARGGSKRIPRKNINFFHGKEMIAWSIEAALKSQCFDRIIVSTDDEEIARVASKYGVDSPFTRPPELSNDYATTTEVVAHAINWVEKNEVKPDMVCCIYATAPFIQSSDIVRGLEVLNNNNCDYVFPVTSYSYPIQRAIRIAKDGSVDMFNPKEYSTRSQDLEAAFHDAGQFYWGKSDTWLKQKKVFDSGSLPIILPSYRVQDIDTQEDWDRAELMFELLYKKYD
jgi:N-acylneuraminate cytidylyltransferase